RFDLARRPVRDVGQRALLDLAVLAISLPQQESRWRCPIRNPINVHDSRESCRFSEVKPKNDIYLGTNSASANRFDSLSMTYAKNARQLLISEELWRRRPLDLARLAFQQEFSGWTGADAGYV